MAWTPFSAEAVRLHSDLLKLNKVGRISEALDLINKALEEAHRNGPSNMTYAEFEAELEARPDSDERPTSRPSPAKL